MPQRKRKRSDKLQAQELEDIRIELKVLEDDLSDARDLLEMSSDAMRLQQKMIRFLRPPYIDREHWEDIFDEPDPVG